MRRPENNEYAPYYEGYVSSIPEPDVLSVLREQPKELTALFAGMPEHRGSFAYAPGKWTIKELLGHIIDAERVFAYRAHRFSHGDTTALSSFDQDIYVRNGRSNERTLESLILEFSFLRLANMELAKTLRDADLDLTGTASGADVTVRALLYIMAGHVRHHMNIIRERYLADAG
ncbi:MAG TPA: DinB family protein [Pyrinomonadaceae bacterium]|nr:DinB family protein [Pyrinomonadaceae bacterium]